MTPSTKVWKASDDRRTRKQRYESLRAARDDLGGLPAELWPGKKPKPQPKQRQAYTTFRRHQLDHWRFETGHQGQQQHFEHARVRFAVATAAVASDSLNEKARKTHHGVVEFYQGRPSSLRVSHTTHRCSGRRCARRRRRVQNGLLMNNWQRRSTGPRATYRVFSQAAEKWQK
ncbi:hypothetical protein Aduo_005518 [Ancylostoma duodenale]